MKHKKQITSVLISFLFILAIYGNPFALNDDRTDQDQDQGRIDHTLVVKVINGEWRVVLEDDFSTSDIRVRRGDRIKWIVEGSDVSFQFPDVRIFNVDTRVVRNDGSPLILTVSSSSPRGEFPYTIFVHNSMTFARGQSPPRIIVR